MTGGAFATAAVVYGIAIPVFAVVTFVALPRIMVVWWRVTAAALAEARMVEPALPIFGGVAVAALPTVMAGWALWFMAACAVIEASVAERNFFP